jgi:hypothetical protein
MTLRPEASPPFNPDQFLERDPQAADALAGGVSNGVRDRRGGSRNADPALSGLLRHFARSGSSRGLGMRRAERENRAIGAL